MYYNIGYLGVYQADIVDKALVIDQVTLHTLNQALGSEPIIKLAARFCLQIVTIVHDP